MTLHDSERLKRAFAARPFQGAEPEQASFMFVGLDANYGEHIEASEIFDPLLEYLDDGVRFWKTRGIHHPFLLPRYRDDGRMYHQTFARIGFRPEHAEQVSFIELLHLPTVGQSKLLPSDLDPGHLRRVRDAIEHGKPRHVFVPPAVGKLMRDSGAFPWMPKAPADFGDPLKVWCRLGSKTIYWHYHLSYWGTPQKALQLRAIGQLIDGSA